MLHFVAINRVFYFNTSYVGKFTSCANARWDLTLLTLGFARGFYSYIFLHFGYLRLSAIFKLNTTMSSHSLNVEPVHHIEILNVSPGKIHHVGQLLI